MDGSATIAADPHEEVASSKLILECQTEAAIDGILVVGARGEVLVINAAFREMWEIGEAQVRVGDLASALRPLMQRVLAAPSPGHGAKAAPAEASGRFSEQLALRDGREVSWTSSPMIDRAGNYHGRVNTYADVTRLVVAERDAVANETRTRLIIDGAGDAIVSCDDDLHILYFNRCAETIFGWRGEDVLWRAFDEVAVAPESREAFVRWLRREGGGDPGARAEFQFVRRGGKGFPAECSKAQRGEGPWVPITLFSRDVSDARRLEAELRQAQKLESVGRLAAGIAHEINTPVQFVGDSVHFLREAAGDLFRVLEAFRALRAAPPEALAERLASAIGLADGADLDFLTDQVPKALDRAADGIQRVAAIVRGMKEFSH
ncbi:MAG TPA: PAS domain S-box protein, partial [Polyangiaceae bacterium]|nr:PAS domain S-box protein [Polyangiaceae bacterium]